ncbi:MAG: hypothetical protein ACE5KT_11665 [Methanosarcinales archaeon]
MTNEDINKKVMANSKEVLREYFRKGLVITLLALTFVSVFYFFFSVMDAIDRLIEYQYVSMFRSFLSLIIVIVSVYFLKVLIYGKK